MKTRLSVIFILTALLAVARTGAGEMPTLAAAIDLTPAIKIGDYTASRYLFEKAYNQFLALSNRRTRQKPGREETEGWFQRYLAHQVVKADLVRRKQLDRPEVREITERMARYMLTQPHGPLYLTLGGADRIAYRRERRTRILRECQFSVIPENIAQLWTALAPRFNEGAPLREADVGPIGSSILAGYFFNGVAKQISMLDFVRDFQQGIARVSPRDVKSLGEQIEDLVVAEFDLIEARSLRLDQTPQFLEDRHNFALIQALAHYEQELLSTQLAISREELAAYYQTNIRRYVSPVHLSGALHVYSDPEQARRGLAFSPEGLDRGPMALSIEVIDPFVIGRDGPPLSADAPYAFLAAVPNGQNYGPFARDGKFVIFFKRNAGELAPVPLEQIQDKVRRDLSREKLDAVELELLSRNRDEIQILLDLPKYDMENPFPAREE